MKIFRSFSLIYLYSSSAQSKAHAQSITRFCFAAEITYLKQKFLANLNPSSLKIGKYFFIFSNLHDFLTNIWLIQKKSSLSCLFPELFCLKDTYFEKMGFTSGATVGTFLFSQIFQISAMVVVDDFLQRALGPKPTLHFSGGIRGKIC